MSRREDPVAPGRGRGSGRNRFESGRGGFRDRGLTPAIGAYLDYAPGLNTNISYISIWSTKIKEYVNTVCETRVGCIFGSNGTVEDYYVYLLRALIRRQGHMHMTGHNTNDQTIPMYTAYQ